MFDNTLKSLKKKKDSRRETLLKTVSLLAFSLNIVNILNYGSSTGADLELLQ